MKYLALSIPGYGTINAPANIPTGGQDAAGNILQTGISVFFIIIIILVLAYIIWGGLDYILSRGDKGKLESSRQKIFWAIVGLSVTFLAILIINVIGYFFGVNFFGLNSNGGNSSQANNQVACDIGGTLNNCKCPIGTTLDESRCISTPPGTEATCIVGKKFDAPDFPYMYGACKCPVNSILDREDNMCLPNNGDILPDCPANTPWDQTGYATNACKCPDNTHYTSTECASNTN